MKTVAQLILELQALDPDLPVVVTMGIGEYPTDPEPRAGLVVFRDGEPMWPPHAEEVGRPVIWL